MLEGDYFNYSFYYEPWWGRPGKGMRQEILDSTKNQWEEPNGSCKNRTKKKTKHRAFRKFVPSKMNSFINWFSKSWCKFLFLISSSHWLWCLSLVRHQQLLPPPSPPTEPPANPFLTGLPLSSTSLFHGLFNLHIII